MSDDLIVRRDGRVLRVLFNRPTQRNAMTWAMYANLVEACEIADNDEEIRVMVLRGAGDDAFVAGTDIGQFAEFSTGDDGIAYEQKVGTVLERLERVRVPTVAAISGYCLGGGLALASVCDLRIATSTARFGIPTARTIGNCLAMNTYSLVMHHWGPSRALDMLLRARMLTADEARTAGFVAELCDVTELDERTDQVVETLLKHAPLTMWAAKEALRRLRTAALPDDEDIVRKVFGSADFHHGVESFLAKQRPQWTGH